MTPLIPLALGGLMLAGTALAQSGDREAGRKVAGMCRTCHGLDGYAQIPIAPHIGGEPESYLARQLAAFKDGSREHEMMTVVSRGLSETQIADVAAWYASHAVTATVGASSGPEPEQCTACHGSNGISVAEDAPNLAGETNIYIETQLKAFRSGKRSHAIMSDIAANMTDAEIRAVSDWFAAIEIDITQSQ